MKSVLVTGGTGDLGQALVERLGHTHELVRVMSRRPPSATPGPWTDWTRASLETGEGLSAAVDGIDCVVHCASAPFGKTHLVDVEGTRKLVQASMDAGVRHLVYISIVGIDKIPFPYYRHKRAAEAVISDARVPFSILRATQFHALLDRFFRDALLRFPVGAVPSRFVFQPIDTDEVAARLVELVEGQPAGRTDDVGGPEILRAGEMARAWTKASGRRRLILPLPLAGAVARSFQSGLNCTPERRYGTITWTEWLARRYGRGEPTH